MEFLDVRPARINNHIGNRAERLRRVYSISEKFMKRNNLYSKFRMTFEYDRFCGYGVADCAYSPETSFR